MAPPVAVADVYLPRGALEMQPRLKVCRALEILRKSECVRALELLLLLGRLTYTIVHDHLN
jgi:hypothetical protein